MAQLNLTGGHSRQRATMRRLAARRALTRNLRSAQSIDNKAKSVIRIRLVMEHKRIVTVIYQIPLVIISP